MFDLGLTTTQLDRLTGQIFTHCTSEQEDGVRNPMLGSGGTDKMKLNVQEFLKHLTVVYKQAQDCSGEANSNSWAFEALDKIGRLILKTPQDLLLVDMEQAALKIQKLYRGRQTRKDMVESKSTETTSATATPKSRGKAKAKATAKAKSG